MARMHSRKKGKSGSHRPLEPSKPTWLTYSDKEVTMLIAKLAKDAPNAAKIGLILRDQYGIPSVKQLCKKGIKEILVEKKLNRELPDDMLDLMKRSLKLRKHIESNKKDQTAFRGLNLTESKILRLSKYHKGAGHIAQDWKYSPKDLSLIITD
jgi:small subunit ribosomal protein S15